MRTAYRVLAYLVALEVVVQAAMIGFAFFGESKFIADGGVIDKALVESHSADFVGVAGFPIHILNGGIVIPLIALMLLVVSFFAKIPQGVRWAGIVLLLVVGQVLLGGFARGNPYLGLLHGMNALALFTTAVIAARRVMVAPAEAGSDAPAVRAGVT